MGMERWAHYFCGGPGQKDHEADLDFLFLVVLRFVSCVGYCEKSNFHDRALQKGMHMESFSAGCCPHQVSPAPHYATSPLPHPASRGTILVVWFWEKCPRQVWVCRTWRQLSACTGHAHQDAIAVVSSAIAQIQLAVSKALTADQKRSQLAARNGNSPGCGTSRTDRDVRGLEIRSHSRQQICRRWRVVEE
jgi:hypothetical protein